MSEQKKSPILLIAAAVIAVLGGGAWFMTQGGETEMAATAQTDAASETEQVDIGEDGLPDLFLGDADAPVEIIEYASFTCPHCANFHTQVYPNLKAEYIDTGKVKLVMREVYFDRYGLLAGLLARCGGDMRYFGIVDLLYKQQSEWARGEGDAIIQNLYRIGRQAGLENDAMQACLSDAPLSEALVADFQLKAGRDEVNSTPSFVINGEKTGNMGWDELKALIDGKLN